jgi:hypothetical protein
MPSARSALILAVGVVAGSVAVLAEMLPLRPTSGVAGVDSPAPAATPGTDPATQAHSEPQRGGARSVSASQTFKVVEFPDVTMGGRPAYRMQIPGDWQSEGQIQWSMGDNVYPQPKVRVSTPEGASLMLQGTATFSYLEIEPLPAMPGMPATPALPPQGDPPPDDIGQWVIDRIRTHNREVSDLRLVTLQRHPEREAEFTRLERQTSRDSRPTRVTMATATLSFLKDGRRFREEIDLSYFVSPPMINPGSRLSTWMLSLNYQLAAPEEQFEQLKPRLLAAYYTWRPNPQWFFHMQQARAQILQARREEVMRIVRQRGEMFDQISEQQMADARRQSRSSDEAQRQRIQGIYEMHDYRDTDGKLVELSIHHKYVFSDGQGRYFTTDNYNDRPTGFTEIQPVK